MSRTTTAVSAVVVALVAALITWSRSPVDVRDKPELLAERAKPPVNAPHVVLVFGCTVRRDQLGLYGGPETMPWLTSAGLAGSVYDDALSVSSWTRASAVGVLTGRHPFAFNLPEPGPKQSQRVLPDDAQLLAETLQGHGWLTVGSTANPNLNEQYGMAQGFDAYLDSSEQAFTKGRHTGIDVVTNTLAELDRIRHRQPEAPVYLQLMLIDAHHPRQPEPAVTRRFSTPGVPPHLAEYRASLSQLDDALRTLDDELEQRGITPENTVFVFVADHGEGLSYPRHHGPGHGKKMYPSTVSIPWVVRGPGVEPGRRVTGLASGVDVLPTLLGLLDLPVSRKTSGVDTSRALRSYGRPHLTRERAYSASQFHVADVAAAWTSTHQCQAYFEHDRDQTVTGCFDRVADPTFTDPIEQPDLRVDLMKWRVEIAHSGRGEEPSKTQVDPELREQLKELGYVE